MKYTFFYTLSLQQAILSSLLGLPSAQQGVITSVETDDEQEAAAAFDMIIQRIKTVAPSVTVECFKNSRYLQSSSSMKLHPDIYQIVNFKQDGKIVGVCHLCIIDNSSDIYSVKGVTLQ